MYYFFGDKSKENSHTNKKIQNLHVYNAIQKEGKSVMQNESSELNSSRVLPQVKGKITEQMKKSLERIPIRNLQGNFSVSQPGVQHNFKTTENESNTNSNVGKAWTNATIKVHHNKKANHTTILKHSNRTFKVVKSKTLRTKTYTKGKPAIDIFQYWLDAGEFHCENESEMEAFPKFMHIQDIIIDRRLGSAPSGGERVTDVLRQKEAKEFVKMRPGFFEVSTA